MNDYNIKSYLERQVHEKIRKQQKMNSSELVQVVLQVQFN